MLNKTKFKFCLNFDLYFRRLCGFEDSTVQLVHVVTDLTLFLHVTVAVVDLQLTDALVVLLGANIFCNECPRKEKSRTFQ